MRTYDVHAHLVIEVNESRLRAEDEPEVWRKLADLLEQLSIVATPLLQHTFVEDWTLPSLQDVHIYPGPEDEEGEEG